MKIEAGTYEKGDVHIIIEDGKRELRIESKVMRIYGEAIKNTVKEMTENIEGKVTVRDFGALDWVLRARLESAIRKFRGEEE